MNLSRECTDLLKALCAARLEFPPIPRNREGFSRKTGQKYTYADISALIDATAPVLAQHSLVLVQSLDDGECGTLQVTTTLFHAASGQWLASMMSVEKVSDPQTWAMHVTYVKRYSLAALLNLSSELDTDAESEETPPASTNG